MGVDMGENDQGEDTCMGMSASTGIVSEEQNQPLSPLVLYKQKGFVR
jgi:hypothetical protein